MTAQDHTKPFALSPLLISHGKREPSTVLQDREARKPRALTSYLSSRKQLKPLSLLRTARQRQTSMSKQPVRSPSGNLETQSNFQRAVTFQKESLFRQRQLEAKAERRREEIYAINTLYRLYFEYSQSQSKESQAA